MKYATESMTPQEIHDLGLKQMDAIMAELREIGARSFATSDPIALLTLVKADPKYRFKSREALIAYAQAALDRARAGLPPWFARLPGAPVIVEPFPQYLEKSAPPGQAVPPTADGKPVKYLVNAYNATAQSTALLEAVTFHETYPGHQLQGATAQENTDLHPIQRYFGLAGFGEGWALYSEQLADEMKLFSSDLDRAGMLSGTAARAARLVTDSGLHGLEWTRQQAVDCWRTRRSRRRSPARRSIAASPCRRRPPPA